MVIRIFNIIKKLIHNDLYDFYYKNYDFFLAQNAQIKTKIHKATVHPPKRLIKKIKNVAVEFLPDAIMVGKK